MESYSASPVNMVVFSFNQLGCWCRESRPLDLTRVGFLPGNYDRGRQQQCKCTCGQQDIPVKYKALPGLYTVPILTAGPFQHAGCPYKVSAHKTTLCPISGTGARISSLSLAQPYFHLQSILLTFQKKLMQFPLGSSNGLDVSLVWGVSGSFIQHWLRILVNTILRILFFSSWTPLLCYPSKMSH